MKFKNQTIQILVTSTVLTNTIQIFKSSFKLLIFIVVIVALFITSHSNEWINPTIKGRMPQFKATYNVPRHTQNTYINLFSICTCLDHITRNEWWMKALLNKGTLLKFVPNGFVKKKGVWPQKIHSNVNFTRGYSNRLLFNPVFRLHHLFVNTKYALLYFQVHIICSKV